MRKPLAILVTALITSSAANAAEIYHNESAKLDIYGKVVGLNYISRDASQHGDKSYVRFGFKGITQISDQLAGFGQWEFNFQTHRPENVAAGNATRLAFAGLRYSNYGSFDYGRNYGVLYDVGAWTDVNPEFGGDSYSTADNFMVGRANNLATFRTPNTFGGIDGLSLALQYQGKNENQKNSENNNKGAPTSDNGDGWGASSVYDMGHNISIGGAFARSNRTAAQKQDKNGNTADAWNVGVKYDNAKLYLAAMFAETHNLTPYAGNKFANKTQNIELAAHYLFVEGPAKGLQPSIAYLQSVGNGLNGVSKKGGTDSDFKGGKHDLVKYIEVGTNYYFNKNMYTYVDYKINLLKKDSYTRAADVNTDNILGLGLVYQF